VDALKRIERIFREVLDAPTLELSMDMAMGDVADWDSIAHVQIILMLEEEFGLRIDPDVAADAKSVAALARAVGGPEAVA